MDASPQEAAVLTASALKLVFLVLNFVAVHVKFSHTTVSHYELYIDFLEFVFDEPLQLRHMAYTAVRGLSILLEHALGRLWQCG